MPIYTYLCKKCSQKCDLLVAMNQDIKELKCPECGSKKLEKQLTSFSISGGSSDGGSSTKCGSCSGGSCSGCH